MFASSYRIVAEEHTDFYGTESAESEDSQNSIRRVPYLLALSAGAGTDDENQGSEGARGSGSFSA
jgi:hypothetical protein